MSSPLLQRTSAPPLTLALLREHVPVVQTGRVAHLRLQLEEGRISASGRKELEAAGDVLEGAGRRELLGARNKGQRSQEALVMSALPLIRNIVTREFQRRRGWNSRVSYDDILQEAIAGFLRGLLSFKNMKDGTSPTNYLGQWITSSVRRKIEVMEHDFAIPYEVVERSRRIKAVRSRLASEMGREPTDEELLNGLNSSEQYNTGYKWGRVTDDDGKQVAKSGSRNFTMKQLEEAREVGERAYQVASQDSPAGDDDEANYERAGSPLTITDDLDHESIDRRDLSRSRAEFFEQAFVAMKMGSKQRDIILRTFGMNPYTHEQSQKEIAAETTYPSRFVKEVMMAFSIYMPQTGGVFHKMLLDTPADRIEELELSWVVAHVGDWPSNQRRPAGPPEILTQNGTRIR